ncbi:MAG: porin, partial [Muribaculaceae bacterium]|nr:porin [Muribaculaceae bacterium]
MKKTLLSIVASLLSLSAAAQYDADTENGVVSFAGRKGFVWESSNKKFEFKPYLMVQTAVDFNYYDSEGLDPAYNQDNVHNSGFSIPYA